MSLVIISAFLLPSCNTQSTDSPKEESTSESVFQEDREGAETFVNETEKSEETTESLTDTKESESSPVFEPQRKEDTVSEPALIVENVTCAQGEKRVAVSISIKNNPGIAAIAVTPAFDSNELTLVDYAVSEEKGGQSVAFNPAVSQPKIIWLHWNGDVIGDWVFATLYFDVSEQATAGKKSVTLSYNADDVYNFMEDNVSFAIIGGSISVE